MRKLAHVLSAAVVFALVGGPVTPAQAVDHAVGVYDDYFSPQNVKAPLDHTVTWTNQGQHQHGVVSNQGFWSTIYLHNPGDGGGFTIWFAGTFAYHDFYYPDSKGSLKVPMKKAGTPEAGWTLTWAIDALVAHRFDVQVKRPGSDHFQAFKSNVTTFTATFNPSQNGTYVFRARTKFVDSTRRSGWSPPLILSIS